MAKNPFLDVHTEVRTALTEGTALIAANARLASEIAAADAVFSMEDRP